jgi:hypothetical protein
MDVLLELVFEIIGEVLMQILFEGVVEVSAEAAGPAARRMAREHPIIAATGFLFIGAFCGLLSVWFVPQRMLPAPRLPGLSMLLSPLCTGFLMQRYGRWQVKRGKTASNLATFWGGAFFAFALAATRYAMISQRA